MQILFSLRNMKSVAVKRDRGKKSTSRTGFNVPLGMLWFLIFQKWVCLALRERGWKSMIDMSMHEDCMFGIKGKK